MLYSVTFDFNDIDVLDETLLRLPNGTVVSFWNCMIKYVNSNDIHYLNIVSDQQQNIKECLILVSFFTTIPFSTCEYEFDEVDENLVEKQSKQLSVIELTEKFSYIENKLNCRANRKRREEILSLMQMCSLGALHDYRGHKEEQFFMYFKPIERVARLELNKTNILTGSASNNRKNFTKNYLKELFELYFNNTIFDPVTLDELAGELNSTLENSLDRKNHRRIVLSMNSIIRILEEGDSTREKLLEKDSTRIQQLVKIRNDIAHGDKVIVTLEDLVDVEYLSRQLMALTFFGVTFEQVHFKSKKFGYDLWSE